MNTRTHLAALAAAVCAGLAGAAWAGDVVCLEAESAIEVTAPMLRTDIAFPPDGKSSAVLASSSGGRYLEIPEGAGKPPEAGGDATIEFTLDQAGTYTLWCRVWWLDGCGNSLGIAINGGKDFTFGQDATYKKWHWVRSPPRLEQLMLSAGKHTLKLMNREDGIAIDQILLTVNPRFIPVGIEKPTPQPKPATPTTP
ncbi:MAG: hypothetical protein BWZ02_00267 [Lentisphaerae bacterium ADurb.BinA184]|nr:MAG: hypothetical protein BWZ02_00267 [Lentisphaerae bacterium ADurb.BinA184]